MRYAVTAMAMLLAVAPAMAQTQANAQEQNPVARLLAHRTELSLTADQVRKLETIEQRTRQQDAPLQAKLAELRGKPVGEPLQLRNLTPEARAKVLANRDAMQPLMRQLGELHAAAIVDARAVLTPEQNGKADPFLYPGMGPGRGARGMRAGQGAGSGRGVMRSGGGMMRGGRGMMQGGRGGIGRGAGVAFRGGRA